MFNLTSKRGLHELHVASLSSFLAFLQHKDEEDYFYHRTECGVHDSAHGEAALGRDAGDDRKSKIKQQSECREDSCKLKESIG